MVLLSLRWGCREHFVSGCWHSSGRDCGRYPRECWLSTLGVLHPGVPVMWYGHIRDLFPTAEGCKGSRLPNVTRLHWAYNKSSALMGCDGKVGEGWLGRDTTSTSLHTQMHLRTCITAPAHLCLPSLPPLPCSWRDALCNQVRCPGRGWQAITPRCPGCPSVRGMRASPRSGNSTGTIPQLLL